MFPVHTRKAYAGQDELSYRVAEVRCEPTADELQWLKTSNVTGLSVWPEPGTRRIFPIGWVGELDRIRFLQIVTPRPVGQMPVEAVRRLEVLWVQGRPRSLLDHRRRVRRADVGLCHRGPRATDEPWDSWMEGTSAIERLTLTNSGVRKVDDIAAMPNLRGSSSWTARRSSRG